MKKNYALLITLIFIKPFASYSQEDLTQFFPAGQNDAGILIDHYISVMSSVIESGLNSGWYNSGDPHAKFGFELNVALNTMFIPTENEYIDINTLGLQNTTFPSSIKDGTIVPGNGNIPSVFGPQNEFPIFTTGSVDTNGNQIFYKGPNGNRLSDNFLINAVVIPSLQFGIGIPFNTDIKIRYTPKLPTGKIQFSNWGVGVMHSIKQHIPALKALPFGWSFFAAYSRLNGTVDLSGQWESSGTLQEGQFHTNTWTIQTVASKDISVLTVYGGIGYNIGNTDFDVKGSYLINTTIDPYTQQQVTLAQPLTFVDPFSFTYNKKSLRITAGMRVKMGPVILFGDYTFQKTSVLSFGLGLTFREEEF